MPPGINIPLGIMFCHTCNDALTEENQSENVASLCGDCCDDNIAQCMSCHDYGWVDYDWATISRAFTANRQMPATQERVPTSIVYYIESEGDYYCENCVVSCSDCGERYATESEAWDCCIEEHYEAIRSYSYKPSPNFFDIRGNGNYIAGSRVTWQTKATPHVLYMGVELEVERASHHAELFLDKANENQHEDPFFVYLKYDGSLGDNGMEIVTMPATLEGFRDMFPFAATDMLKEKGARAWAYTNCGMHVHVSRSAFTASHMWKFIKWQTENWQKCVQFAGRESQQWAAWNNQNMDVCRTKTSRAVKERGYTEWNNRYSAINLTQRDTIELRYFRPNLNKDGILRVLEFIQAIYDYTKQMSYSDVFGQRYEFSLLCDFMEGKEEYKHALDYIKVNGI